MAAEAAAPAASGEAAGAASASRPGGPAAPAPGGGSGLPSAPQQAGKQAKGVLLAIAILLLWLAGFCFFIALEGSQLLTEQSDTTGGGLARAIVSGLAAKASAQEASGTGSG